MDGGEWAGFVSLVKSNKPMLASLLEHGRPLKVSAALLEIGFTAGSFELKQVQDADALAELKALARGHYRQETDIRVVSLTGVPGDAPPTLSEKKSLEAANRLRRLTQDATEHPMVAALNKHTFTRESIDEGSYVAMAGFVTNAIHDRIERAIKTLTRRGVLPRLVQAQRRVALDGGERVVDALEDPPVGLERPGGARHGPAARGGGKRRLDLDGDLGVRRRAARDLRRRALRRRRR